MGRKVHGNSKGEKPVSVREKPGIFIPNPEKKAEEDRAKSVVVYTIDGNGDFTINGFDILEDSKDELAQDKPDAYAKAVDNTRFFVKRSRQTSNFMDPISFSAHEDQRYIKTHGSSQWVFKEVSKKVFDLYLNFLKTRNANWLKNAEREALNG